jgi:hypothetical protein
MVQWSWWAECMTHCMRLGWHWGRMLKRFASTINDQCRRRASWTNPQHEILTKLPNKICSFFEHHTKLKCEITHARTVDGPSLVVSCMSRMLLGRLWSFGWVFVALKSSVTSIGSETRYFLGFTGKQRRAWHWLVCKADKRRWISFMWP